MQPDPAPKSKSLFAVTELTLVATLKEGCIPAQDTRSYFSRAALVMKALNTLRQSSKEVDPTPLIDDVVDDIRAIHSFRLSLLPAPARSQLMLSVTFDGGWEPYMRQIWRDLGPLLDLIFCNCEDYPLSNERGYADYIAWVRRCQVNTDFFYNAGPMTVNDLHYLRRRERERVELGARLAHGGANANDRFLQAMPAIAALYRLSDMYPPATEPDGGVLRRAAWRVLGSAVTGELGAYQALARTATERAALQWVQGGAPSSGDGAVADGRRPDLRAVQGGILDPYNNVTHVCLLLLQLRDAAAAQALLTYVKPPLVRSAANQLTVSTQPFVNLAFTWPGLVIAGLPEGLQKQLPLEFREGMAARAGILGDWRRNHPSRWALPLRNWPVSSTDRVELSSVHAVLQLQISMPGVTTWSDPVTDSGHPLATHLQRIAAELDQQGARVLSVQPMQRLGPLPGGLALGHFGYADGISQPTLQPDPSRADYHDDVPPGDLLLGFASALDPRPALTGPLWDHSTFLVIRKLRQDVPAFEAALQAAAGAAKASLMGRGADGNTLIHHKPDNDFDYGGDPRGAACPFQAHMRRANPRTPRDVRPDQRRVPRLLRRGMSYGPPLGRDNADDDRGMVFMAYNASIAEQFEVIQAWLAGGNSASRDSWSGQRDPFVGVALDDEPQAFVVEAEPGGPLSVAMDPAKPWTTLQWGLYLFVPSLPALDQLQRLAQEAAALDAARDTTAPADDRRKRRELQDLRIGALAALGGQLIRGLKQKEQQLGADAARTQWKLALEDLGARMSGRSQAIWTAVREQFGGVLRTPYGVLVAERQKVMDAFAASPPQLTATGYLGRMEPSFGPIYLGLDDGVAYQKQATLPNRAIQSIKRPQAFQSAFEFTLRVLETWLQPHGHGGELAMDVKDLSDEVLALLSTKYFGLPDGAFVQGGGWHWEERQARCPGHFNAPSRYMFQPHPGEEAARTGQRHGQLLRAQVRQFVAARRVSPALKAPIERAILGAFPTDNDLAARTLIGVLMGFLPTVDGNLRAVLYEWVSDRRLWDLQSDLIAAVGPVARPTMVLAEQVLLAELTRTMQLRPVPELTWRKAVARHTIGNADVQPGETVVIGIVSATQQDLLRGEDSLEPLFGGDRHAPGGHPTHACPGYEMAMGVLLGVLAGLMWSVRLRPTLNPMTLKIARRQMPAASAAGNGLALRATPSRAA